MCHAQTKHIHTLQETLKITNVGRGNVHELVEALKRMTLKCLSTKLALGNKGGAHTSGQRVNTLKTKGRKDKGQKDLLLDLGSEPSNYGLGTPRAI